MKPFICSSRREEAHSKKCFTLALTLTLSPGEREQQLDVLYFAEVLQAAGRFQFARRLGAFLPLRGERAGVREVFTTKA
jgi:hypothetical protein